MTTWKLISTIITIVLWISLFHQWQVRRKNLLRVSNGDGADADPAYFGTWKRTDGNGCWYQITISADKLVFLDDSGDGYTVSGLTWDEMDAPRRNAGYLKGYWIVGKLDAVNVYPLPKFQSSQKAEVGEYAYDVWYIGTDGQSLSQGAWSKPYAPWPLDATFVKQPDVAE